MFIKCDFYIFPLNNAGIYKLITYSDFCTKSHFNSEAYCYIILLIPATKLLLETTEKEGLLELIFWKRMQYIMS